MGLTNKGKAMLMECLQGTGPTSFFVALCTTEPTADTNTLSELTQIAAGNGYSSGGYPVLRNTTGLPTVTEDDTNDKGTITLQDVIVIASGGAIPVSGSVFRYPVLTDDNANIANREVYMWWDLGTQAALTDGTVLILNGMKVEAA